MPLNFPARNLASRITTSPRCRKKSRTSSRRTKRKQQQHLNKRAAGERAMRVFHGFEALPHFTHPAVTVGSYDGVHSGHLKLLRTVTAAARGQGGESIVFTFEPHPRITLGKADGLRLLTSSTRKSASSNGWGIDNLVIIPFDRAFSRLVPMNSSATVARPYGSRNARRRLQPPLRTRQTGQLRLSGQPRLRPAHSRGLRMRRGRRKSQFDGDPAIGRRGKNGARRTSAGASLSGNGPAHATASGWRTR